MLAPSRFWTKISILLFAITASVSTPVYSAISCIDILGRGLETAGIVAPQWQRDLEVLSSQFNEQNRQPFAMKALSDPQQRISVNAKNFSQATYRIKSIKEGKRNLPEGARLIENIEFGYQLADGFRKLGKINFMTVDAKGNVIEVGGGSREVLKEFKSHLFGRILSESELRVITEINNKIIDHLRVDPQAQAKVQEFVKKRQWPEGIEKEAKLAYFSEEILDLKAWAIANGYTMEQMRDAGWFLMKFDSRDQPLYSVNYVDSIKIPYFTDADQSMIPIWRTRDLNPKPDGPKYRSWQSDRSIQREMTVAETLYNGWKLSQVRGKTLVITEGEFKCMIATKASGILNVGIPGITQFDARIAKAIVDAGPSEVIVVLDRDPSGKGMMRVDEITDSQRAAYAIALELVKAGGINIKVGILPDVFDGSKVGADDLILAKGVAPYLQTLKDSVSPEEYARKISLDTDLHEKMVKRQKISKALSSYWTAVDRGSNEITKEIVERLDTDLQLNNKELKDSLARKFGGATSFQAPSARYPSLRMKPEFQLRHDDAAILAKGKYQPMSLFSADILFMDYRLKDLHKTNCRPGPCQELNMTREQFKKITDGKVEEVFREDFERGYRLLKELGLTVTDVKYLSTLILAGKLAHDFPLDEFHFEFNVGFKDSRSSSVPIVIYKKSSGNAVAFARLRITEKNEENSDSLFEHLSRYLRR